MNKRGRTGRGEEKGKSGEKKKTRKNGGKKRKGEKRGGRGGTKRRKTERGRASKRERTNLSWRVRVGGVAVPGAPRIRGGGRARAVQDPGELRAAAGGGDTAGGTRGRGRRGAGARHLSGSRWAPARLGAGIPAGFRRPRLRPAAGPGVGAVPARGLRAHPGRRRREQQPYSASRRHQPRQTVLPAGAALLGSVVLGRSQHPLPPCVSPASPHGAHQQEGGRAVRPGPSSLLQTRAACSPLLISQEKAKGGGKEAGVGGGGGGGKHIPVGTSSVPPALRVDDWR